MHSIQYVYHIQYMYVLCGQDVQLSAQRPPTAHLSLTHQPTHRPTFHSHQLTTDGDAAMDCCCAAKRSFLFKPLRVIVCQSANTEHLYIARYNLVI
jgi:hypothetical protein